MLEKQDALSRQRHTVPSVPPGTIPSEELGRVGPSVAKSWQPNGVGHARSDRGLAGTAQRGRSPLYSNLAMETGHLLRCAFGRPWRQTEGLLRSVVNLLGVSLAIPDHTTFSRRSVGLLLSTPRPPTAEPVHVVIDSTGLKVYNAGE